MRKRRAKGNGYLVNNPDGSKTLIMSLKDPSSGKTKKIQVTAPTEAACLKRMRKRLSEESMDRSPISNMTVTQLCNSHLEMQYRQGLIKRTSRDRNDITIRNQIENYPLGHMQVHGVTSKDIDDHFDELIRRSDLSVSSMEKVKYLLDAAFKWAVSRGELRQNPVDSIRARLSRDFGNLRKKGADDEDVKILTSGEETLIIATSLIKHNEQYQYPGGLHFRFLLNTGLRVGEYICLRWKDYDPENHILSITKSVHQVKTDNEDSAETNYLALEGTTKNSKARNIELTDEAIYVINEIFEQSSFKDPDDYIVLTRTGRPYTATSMEHIVDTLYRNAGVADTVSGLHILRRTFATKLFREGYSLKEVAAYLGDEEATVSRYYIAARETKEVNGRRIAVVSLKRNS